MGDVTPDHRGKPEKTPDPFVGLVAAQLHADPHRFLLGSCAICHAGAGFDFVGIDSLAYPRFLTPSKENHT